MPSVPIHPPSPATTKAPSPLPPILHTPTGLAILELQSTIHFAPGAMEDDGITPIGRLEFPENVMTGEWDGKSVWAYIGEHQRMRGEVKKLKAPLGVLKRKTVGNPPSEGFEGEELEIVEIIKYKILFSERPEPVS